MTLFHSNVTSLGHVAEPFISAARHYGIQLICETHLRGDKAQATASRLARAGWCMFQEEAAPSHRSSSGTCGGIAIIAQRHLGVSAVDPAILAEASGPEVSHRRWHAAVCRLKRCSLLLIEVYLHTAQGLSAANLGVLKQIEVLVKLMALPCIIAGDWNMPWSTLADAPFLHNLHLQVVKPSGVQWTCRNPKGTSIIDFFVISRCLEAAVLGSWVVSDVPWSPHAGVALELSARPCSFRAFRLVTPKPWPLHDEGFRKALGTFHPELWSQALDRAEAAPSLLAGSRGPLEPFRDLLAQECPDWHDAAVLVGQRFARASRAAQFYANAVFQNFAQIPEGSKDTWRTHRTFCLVRGTAPRRSRVRTVKAVYAGAHPCESRSAFWFRLSNQVRNVACFEANSQCAFQASLILRALLTQLDNQLSVLRESGSETALALAEYDWPSSVSMVLRCSSSEIQALLARIQDIKRWALRQQADAARRRFKQWIVASLCKPAALHRYTNRNNVPVLEWAQPHASAAHVEAAIASRADAWEAIWHKAGTPVRDVIKAVGLLRRTALRERAEQKLQRDFPAQLAWGVVAPRSQCRFEAANSVSGVQLQQWAAAYPKKFSRGGDGWCAAELSALPCQVLQPFADVLELAETHLAWPLQMAANLMAILGKPTGGERVVAKTPILYRIWARAEQSAIRAWEAANTAPHDSVGAGLSAELASALRGLQNEIATGQGMYTANTLWDIEKFFDSVCITDIVSAALAHGYPGKPLVLGAMQHIAPRLLQVGLQASRPILVANSILAGCAQSVPWVKALFHSPISEVARRSPQVCTRTYVDDVAQTTAGSFVAVAQNVVDAGVALVQRFRKLKLVLAAKSTVLASSPRLAALIVRMFAAEGITVAKAAYARDLGIANAAGCLLPRQLRKGRLAKATIRTRRLKTLVCVHRGARALFAAGAKPQAAWAWAAEGATQSEIAQLRKLAAAASGISTLGRCTTTAVALTCGHAKDPAALLVRDSVKLWHQLWRLMPEAQRIAVSRQWARCCEEFKELSPLATVSRIKGPISATVSILLRFGWQPFSPAAWVDPAGHRWNFQPGFGNSNRFLDEVASFAQTQLWREAARKYLGRGLQCGVDWPASIALLQRISKRSDGPSLVGLLEAFMCAALWPPGRSRLLAPCCKCGRAGQTLLHELYECTFLQSLRDPAVVGTQHLCAAASSEQSQECLWLRGLLPAAMTEVSTPFPEVESWTVLGDSPRLGTLWPGGTYYTDASGGAYGIIPQLRRCGVAGALLDGDKFIWGFHGPLPGRHQTIPRAELFAIVTVLRTVDPAASLVICTDSQIAVRQFTAGRSATEASLNCDVWEDFWNCWDLRLQHCATTSLRWVKGHVDAASWFKYNCNLNDFVGNGIADALANRAAADALLPPRDVQPVLKALQLVQLVQARALAILPHFIPKHNRGGGFSKPPGGTGCASLSALAWHLASTHHVVATVGGAWQCAKCFRRAPSLASVKDWQHLQCNAVLTPASRVEATTRPVPISSGATVGYLQLHQSHKLFILRGIWACSVCGAFATIKPAGLAVACKGGASKEGARVLKRLRAGLLPFGVRQWPADYQSPLDQLVVDL